MIAQVNPESLAWVTGPYALTVASIVALVWVIRQWQQAEDDKDALNKETRDLVVKYLALLERLAKVDER